MRDFMKIIIPMTGYGSRFVAAGYKELKPFIRVLGRPVIQWIIDGMYPKGTEYIFICRGEHLDRYQDIIPTLKTLAPGSQIFSIDPWIKLGPVYDVLQASAVIPDDEQCIVNYCDFYQHWDFEQFKYDVTLRGCEGAVPCYTGFHPHLLVEKNVYASCLVDKDENLVEIREKYSFESDKMKALHSPGIYYFKSGGLMKKYFRMLVDEKTMLNGEYYASLPYNNMVKDGLKVWCPANVTKFCQWGTPEDMRESEFWLNLVLEAMRR
jgi:NDP-sugar pyrophosphorylase family protein